MKTALIAIVAATAACGGTAKPESTPATSQDSPSPAGDSAAKPRIEKFHDTLAPRWHAEKGPQRMADTCAAQPQFRAEAEAIAAAQPPGGDAAAWVAQSKQLTDAVAALEAPCSANDAVAFEPAFERVHDTFHSVMDAASGHHGKHGEGKHGEDKH